MTQNTLTMDEVKPVAVSRRRWGIASASLGGALWLLAPLVPHAWPHRFGSVEHLLVFMPLVGVPLGMLLHARLIEPGAALRAPRLAQLLQPFAALLVLASFGLPKGPTAAGLLGLWLATALVFAGTGSYRSGLNVAAAQLLMPIGGLWLVFNRLDLHPAGLSDERVLMGALHFQFSGFAAQLVAAATLQKASQRWMRVALVVGLPLIAAGNIVTQLPLRALGVFTVIAGTLGLATVLVTSSRAAALLRVSGFALFAGMLLALAHALGWLTGAPRLDVQHMALTHGMLNALGFTLFGLIGHLRQSCDAAPGP